MITGVRKAITFLALLIPLAAPWQLPAGGEALAVIDEFDRIAARLLWPSFDARTIPVAVYDGARTYLCRHPAPPEGFVPLEGRPDLRVFAGLHPSVRANTSTKIGSAITATLMIEPGNQRPVRDLAATLVHECFHAFQRQHHPSWAANEATLFTYPVEDAEGLALSRLEMQALRRALAGDPACWAARAIKMRRERFARLPSDAVAYERGTELHEGLAQYVESLAAGRKDVRSLARDFSPSEIRLRAYVSGEALARLLDQLVPDWKSKVGQSLDELLPEPGSAECDFSDAEREAARKQALADVGLLKRRRAELLHSFQARTGWRITVEAANGMPLFAQGFDPMNVERLSEREVLHKRWIKLGNDAGYLEVLGHDSLTTGVGAHPLFNGVRAWTVTGLPVKPEVSRDAGKVLVTTPAIRVSFAGADIESQPRAIIIRLHRQSSARRSSREAGGPLHGLKEEPA